MAIALPNPLNLLRWFAAPWAEEPADEETPRYPPFMKGLPVQPVTRLLATQDELIQRIRRAVGISDALFDSVYLPLIERYAAYVHLLPASESHHHRGAGGLLRHGLEVALWAIQGSDRVMFCTAETPERRRDLEPRWKCGVFVAALLHDIGKPLSDLRVTEASGDHEWDSDSEDLVAWAHRVEARRYFLHWRQRRHQRHESLTPLVLPHVLPAATRDYLRAAGPELYESIVFAVSSRDFHGAGQEYNPIFNIVRTADQHSTRKDIGDPVAAGLPGELGIPLERYIMDAIRQLAAGKKWKCNKPGARLWVIDGTLYMVWPACANDIVQLLDQNDAPGIPRHPDTLADVLIDRGLVAPFEEAGGRGRVWPIRPAPLREVNPGVTLNALCMDDNANVFKEWPASVDGEVGAQLLAADKEQAQAPDQDTTDAAESSFNTVAAVTDNAEASDETGTAASQPDVGADEARSAESSQNNTEEQPNETQGQDKPTSRTDNKQADHDQAKVHSHTAETRHGKKTHQSAASSRQAATPGHTMAAKGASETPQAAQAWFGRGGHAGAIISALAEDFAENTKQWGRDGVQTAEDRVAIRHPEGWQGAGIPSKEVLPLLTEVGWIALDPLNPTRRAQQVAGFTRIKGNSETTAVILTDTVSAHFLAVANAQPNARSDAPSDAQARDQPTTSTPDNSASKTKRGNKNRQKSRKNRENHPKSNKNDKNPKQQDDATPTPEDGKASLPRSQSDASPDTPDRDAVVASLQQAVDANELTCRQDNGWLYTSYTEAMGVLADRMEISRSRAGKLVLTLTDDEDTNQVVFPKK